MFRFGGHRSRLGKRLNTEHESNPSSRSGASEGQIHPPIYPSIHTHNIPKTTFPYSGERQDAQKRQNVVIDFFTITILSHLY
jgi:hypothetical protein